MIVHLTQHKKKIHKDRQWIVIQDSLVIQQQSRQEIRLLYVLLIERVLKVYCSTGEDVVYLWLINYYYFYLVIKFCNHVRTMNSDCFFILLTLLVFSLFLKELTVKVGPGARCIAVYSYIVILSLKQQCRSKAS